MSRMDKIRARIKALKRAEKELRKEEEAQQVFDDFNAHCKSHGIKNVWSKKKIMQVKHEIDKELEISSNLICVVASAYSLHKLYGFGKSRLFEFCHETHNRIVNAYNGERSAYQFAEELKAETGLVIDDYFTADNKPKPTGPEHYRERVNAMWYKIPVILNITMYSIYWRFGFRHKRMKRICEAVCNVIRLILQENNIKHYMAELERHGLTITMSGQFRADISDSELMKIEQRSFVKV